MILPEKRIEPRKKNGNPSAAVLLVLDIHDGSSSPFDDTLLSENRVWTNLMQECFLL